MQNSRSTASSNLLAGKLLAKNTIWNLVGQGAPIIAAVFAIPLLVKALGIERFGILTLVWMVVGYFSLFDFGMGRALTQIVAEKLGTGHHNDIPAIAWTALLLMLLLGLVGVIFVAWFSPWFVMHALKIPAVLQKETIDSFYLLSLSIPVVISTTALRGILEAYQRFDLVNIIRVPMGLFTFLAPLAVLPFSKSLISIVAVLVGVRLIAWIVHFVFCLHVVPALRKRIAIKADLLKPLFCFGSWMTITNLIGPLMMYLDRFLIGAFVSIAAVAYYTTPYEMVTKLLILPASLVGVLFPAFASSLALDRNRTAHLFQRGTIYIFIFMFPIIFITVIFAPEIIRLWLGFEFMKESTAVLRWLAVGVLLNSLAQVPFALIQGAGRPDLTARLHLVELPFYLVILWYLLNQFGIEGTAIAWLVRVLADNVILFLMAHFMLPGEGGLLRFSVHLVVALSALFLGVMLNGLLLKGLYTIAVLAVFFITSWLMILKPEERGFALKNLKIIAKQ